MNVVGKAFPFHMICESATKLDPFTVSRTDSSSPGTPFGEGESILGCGIEPSQKIGQKKDSIHSRKGFAGISVRWRPSVDLDHLKGKVAQFKTLAARLIGSTPLSESTKHLEFEVHAVAHFGLVPVS